MAASNNLSNAAFIYKRHYSEREVGDLAKRRHPTFAMVSREGEFTGTAFYYAVRGFNLQSISATFADARKGTNGTSNYGQGYSHGLQFAASRKKKYAIYQIDAESMYASEGKKGGFLKLVTDVTDGAIEEFGDDLAIDFFRDGSGVRGRRSSASSNVITLTEPSDVRNFKINMTVGADDTAAATSVRSGTTYVTALDPDAGTVTLADASQISGFTNNDYMFRQGDQAAACEGLAALFPLAAPTASESFRGVDRSVAPQIYAGVRTDDSATNPEENIGLTCVKIGILGQDSSIAPLNPIEFWKAARRLNAKVTYDGGGVKAAMGFQGIDVHTPAGTVRAVSDPDCPRIRGYVLNLSTLYAKHMQGLPHVVRDDGQPALRLTDEDSIEGRVRGWWNLICTRPGANGVYSIA